MATKRLRNVFRRSWLPLLIVGVVMLVLSLAVTCNLPTPSVYEVRYEMYVVGDVRPDTMVKDLVQPSPDSLCHLLQEASQQCASEVSVWSDKTGKLTLRVRNDQESVALQEAAALFARVESVSTFDSLSAASMAAETEKAASMSSVEPVPEVVLLNEAAAHQARLTPERWLVVLVAVLASLLLSGIFLLFRFYASNADEDGLDG